MACIVSVGYGFACCTDHAQLQDNSVISILLTNRISLACSSIVIEPPVKPQDPCEVCVSDVSRSFWLFLSSALSYTHILHCVRKSICLPRVQSERCKQARLTSLLHANALPCSYGVAVFDNVLVLSVIHFIRNVCWAGSAGPTRYRSACFTVCSKFKDMPAVAEA